MTYFFPFNLANRYLVFFSVVMKTNKRQKRKKQKKKKEVVYNVKVVLLFDTPTPYEEHQNFAISKQLLAWA